MKCIEANNYIMKYMDGEITSDEATTLNEHLLKCQSCKQEFDIYESMIVQFEALPNFEAPDGFELEVMTQITALSENIYQVDYQLKEKSADSLWKGIWGTFTVLIGAGTILVLYRDPIMASLAQNPYVGTQIQRMMPVADKVAQASQIIKLVIDKTVSAADVVLSNSMGIVFAMLAVICGVQVYLLHRKRKFDKADD